MTTADSLLWDAVWTTTAEAIGRQVEAGRQHLMTEDTLRFATVAALQQHGVDPGRLQADVPVPGGGRGRIDLLVTGRDDRRTAIEFRFPRDARGPISPDTTTYGDLLRDFHHVAGLPVDGRWVVQLLGDRLRGYLTRAATRYPIVWPATAGGTFHVHGEIVARLPRTARDAIGDWPAEHDVTARCEHLADLPGGLTFGTYAVVALPGAAVAAAPATAYVGPRTGQETARACILAAATRLVERSGEEEFRRDELIREVRRGGCTHADGTVSTMISGHLSVEPGHEGPGQHADLVRAGHGRYRLRSREGDRTGAVAS